MMWGFKGLKVVSSMSVCLSCLSPSLKSKLGRWLVGYPEVLGADNQLLQRQSLWSRTATRLSWV